MDTIIIIDYIYIMLRYYVIQCIITSLLHILTHLSLETTLYDWWKYYLSNTGGKTEALATQLSIRAGLRSRISLYTRVSPLWHY